MKSGKDIKAKRGSCPNCPPKKSAIHALNRKINVSKRNEN